MPKLAALLEGYRGFLKPHSSLHGFALRFAGILDGFRVAWDRSRQVEAAEAQFHRASHERLLSDYRKAREEWAETQREAADEFNLFEVMEVAHDEIRHSMILAWLLDCRIERGTHAQGNLGLRLFLEELARDLGIESAPAVLAYADEPYWVRREVSCSASIVDIEIAARRKFIIHIENKIHSREGENQTDREWKGLTERAGELAVSASHVHAIYLTLDGSVPENEKFVPVSWSRIVRVLEKFADEAQPSEVKLFAGHYARALRKLSLTEPQPEEIEDGETVV